MNKKLKIAIYGIKLIFKFCYFVFPDNWLLNKGWSLLGLGI